MTKAQVVGFCHQQKVSSLFLITVLGTGTGSVWRNGVTKNVKDSKTASGLQTVGYVVISLENCILFYKYYN